MNAKRCKQLRKIAREATVGRPIRRLIEGTGALRNSAVNDPGTTRGFYRTLKREART